MTTMCDLCCLCCPCPPFCCISPSAIIEPIIDWFVKMMLPVFIEGGLSCPCCSFMGGAMQQAYPPPHGPYY
jgi:hypothetical protein